MRFLSASYDCIVTDFRLIVERKPNPGWKVIEIANTSSHLLAFAKSGTADYQVGERRFRVGAGDVLYFPKGQVHTGISDPDDPWSFYTVTFDIAPPQAGDPPPLAWLDTVTETGSAERYQFAALFAELHRAWMRQKPGYLMHCRSVLTNLLYLLIQQQADLRDTSVHSEAIEQAISLMLERPRDSFSIAELADLAGLSPSHFRMLFKQTTGLSVVQYQNRLKINRARDLLLSGGCNVTEAADFVGIPDIYYFSRLFKKLTGVSPSAYKKL
ncbi:MULTISPECIES: AraC family transcriptional regulator [unclassified Paenibacillus]|uniref:helix-turn-helix domain-containing protein n=1 Tax=unclassified Paenibacillus TaxID=185978 RepID=UPI00210E1023|nr:MULTISPECIES: AraC family transcriptional regulator [unclassified Paenibacillus]